MCPSRSALMTGMHTVHTVVRGNKEIQTGRTVIYTKINLYPAEALKKADLHHRAFRKWGPGFSGGQKEIL